MKIAATAVSMDAARTYKEVEQRISGVTLLSGGVDASTPSDDFSVRLSRTLASSTQTQLTTRSVVGDIRSGSEPAAPACGDSAVDSKKVLSQLAEQVLGQPTTINRLLENPAESSPSVPVASGRNPSFRVQTALLSSSTFYSQEETLLFSARGAVQTTDGREIAFDLGLSMERSTVEVSSVSMDMAAVFMDPLILQFDTASPLLSDSSFFFDLDSDGEKEQLACPGGGCGFLAFDRNGDGVINNGFELFGPSSGSGFGELAEFDTDANQWIDENDPIFDQLLIWRQDGQGGESLLSLREAGVGALAVIHAGTAFQLENSAGEIMGAIKANGIFLTEDGEVRSLQEVDLAVATAASDTDREPRQSEEGVFDVAIHVLRDIINMQRLRLRMMLTGRRLQQAVAKEAAEAAQADWLVTRQQRHHQWQALSVGQSEEETPGVADKLSSSAVARRNSITAEATGEGSLLFRWIR